MRRTRDWLRASVGLRLDARAARDGVRVSEVERQEDTVLRALELLERSPGVVIADEVGMGKTFEALGVVAAQCHRDPKCKVAVVTPGPDLNEKWEGEFERFSDREAQIFDFGGAFQAVYDLPSFIEAAKDRNTRAVVVPVSAFHDTRADEDQALLLSLYFEWKQLHGHTVNAILRRYRGGRLEGFATNELRFLGRFDRTSLEPHLEHAFRAGYTGPYHGLDDLYVKYGGNAAFESDELVKRAIDFAKFRVVRALLPDFDLLVIDEAHKLKNAHTVRSQAVATIFRRKFEKALFLTATPFQLTVGELGQVFEIFSLAKNAPKDVTDRAERLFTSIEQYQRAYRTLEEEWTRLDEESALAFAELYAGDPDLAGPIVPGLHRVVEAVRSVKRLKEEEIEPGFREWMIRSLREDKREYRAHDRKRLKPAGEGVLPFLVYERFIAELFRQKETTHKASVEVNMVSSYAAARRGALLDESGRELPASAEAYRTLLRRLLDDLRTRPSSHPKFGYLVLDVLKAAEQGEKTLIFCKRVETLAGLANAISSAWEQHVLDLWQRTFPGATAEEVFDEHEGDERSRGLHTRLQARFQRPQDALYLALRERHLHTFVPRALPERQRWDEVIDRANVALEGQLVAPASVERIDWRLLQRCIEHAAAAALPADDRLTSNEAVLRDEAFVRLGLSRSRADSGEGGSSAPSWRIREDAARHVLEPRDHLWSLLGNELPKEARTRVRVVEGLARYLTFRDIPFLADLLAAAKDRKLNVKSVESQAFLEFVDEFWTLPAGRLWLERLRAFLTYFNSRNEKQREAILEGPLKTRGFVRQTRDGESRERLREAFNTPLFPMVLVANEVMQEGLDLHRNCRRVVHHDLDWNPAQIEQRVGRVDRLGSLIARLRESDPNQKLEILYPLIERTIDMRLYRTVKSREKWLEFLLGAAPQFAEFDDGGAPVRELPHGLAESLAVRLHPKRATTRG